MKKKSKVFMSALVMALVAAFLISGTVFAKSNWYTKLRKSRKKEFSYYRGLDINQDGKYELFLSNQKGPFLDYEGKIELWTRYKKKNVCLLAFDGGGGCRIFQYKKKKMIGVFFRLSGEKTLFLFKLKKGRLVPYGLLDYYAPHHYPLYDNAKAVYRINSRDVSKTTWKKKWKKYYASKYQIRFYNKNK